MKKNSTLCEVRSTNFKEATWLDHTPCTLYPVPKITGGNF